LSEEEIPLEEFEKLPEAAPGVRRRLIDYDAATEELLSLCSGGKAVSIGKLLDILQKHHSEGKKVYYSQGTNFIEKLKTAKDKNGNPLYHVEVRFGSVKYVYVRKA